MLRLNEALHKDDRYSEDLLYFKNIDQFMKNIAAYQSRFHGVSTNEECVLPTYCLRMIEIWI